MKLKVALLVSSLLLSLSTLGQNIAVWRYPVFQLNTNFQFREASSLDEAIRLTLNRFVLKLPINRPASTLVNVTRVEFLDYINKNVTTVSRGLFNVPQSYRHSISNIVTGEVLDSSDLVGSGSPYTAFVIDLLCNCNNMTNGIAAILKDNSLLELSKTSTSSPDVIINVPALFYNYINLPQNKNLDILSNYVSEILLILKQDSEVITSILTQIESNQLDQSSSLSKLISRMSDVTNSLNSININSSYAVQHLQRIKDVTSTFAADQKIKQLASGQIFSTLNPLDEGDEGVIYDALDQLVRLNMLKQGNNITESELHTMSSSDKWINSGLAVKYGSYADNYNNRNIGIIVGSEAIKENENFQNKVNTLSQLSDANGNLVDPLTGELTKLTNAIREWDKSKVDGALASYSYNNPAATNGFFGAIKRNLTEEGDWRLLDNKHKDKQQSFMDNLTQSGIKINTSTGPVHVELNQNQPIAITLPEDIFSSKSIKTYDANTAALYQNWLDWRVLWSNFSGVENHNDRGYLDIMLDRNDYFYSFVTNNMYSNFSNQLSRLIQLNELTNKSTFVDIPSSTYVRYLRRGIGTVDNNDDDLFAIKDEPTFNHDGSTNFEQAVVFQLNDLFNVMQNGSKADMMSADFIRGIYRVLGTGSNLVSQLEYITNTVYQANGISTDSESYAVYGESLEELENNLSDVNETISEIHRQSKERIDSVVLNLFADYTLPNKLVLLEFNGQRFEINLNKYADVFHMIHACASVAWLTIALLLLPRVIYMVLCFSLRMLSKFYGIMRS